MKFSKEDIFESKEVYDNITDRCIGESRWSVQRERVFEHEGKFYKVHYSQGSTKYQDDGPEFAESGDEIECKEVFPKQVTVTVYE